MAKARRRLGVRGAVATANGNAGRSRASGALHPSSGRRSQADFGSEVWEPVSLPADRRRFIPVQPGSMRLERRQAARFYEPARRFSSVPARVVAAPPRKSAKTRSKGLRGHSMAALLFDQPQNVVVCVKRQRRREVMHAIGVAGSQVKRGRPGAFSKIYCRR